MKPKNRTSAGLRDLLFDEIDAVRSGEAEPRRAVAVAKLAQQIVSTVKVEAEFIRRAQIENMTPPRIGSLKLGSS